MATVPRPGWPPAQRRADELHAEAGGLAEPYHVRVHGHVAGLEQEGGRQAQRVVLGHIMQRTEEARLQSLAAISEHYDGPVEFASDLACFRLP